MRWKQVYNPELGKHEMVPIDEAAFKRDHGTGPIIRGNFDAFKSPIDGEVITTQRQYDDYCKKHNVVPMAAFGNDHFERAERERAKVFKAEHSPQEQWERRAQLNELINQMERQS